MAQRLHLVFGGELVDPSRTEFRDVNDLHILPCSDLFHCLEHHLDSVL